MGDDEFFACLPAATDAVTVGAASLGGVPVEVGRGEVSVAGNGVGADAGQPGVQQSEVAVDAGDGGDGGPGLRLSRR